LKPNDNYFHQLLGEALEKENKYAEAEAEYREALRLKPDDFSSQSDLDRVLAHEGKEKSKP
jgi:Flp pilus assembly protein TadD